MTIDVQLKDGTGMYVDNVSREDCAKIRAALTNSDEYLVFVGNHGTWRISVEDIASLEVAS